MLGHTCLPKFSLTWIIQEVKLYLFDTPQVTFNLILKCSFLNMVAIDVLSLTKTCIWLGAKIPFHLLNHLNNTTTLKMLMEVPTFQSKHGKCITPLECPKN